MVRLALVQRFADGAGDDRGQVIAQAFEISFDFPNICLKF
jgi:hypothetical protein